MGGYSLVSFVFGADVVAVVDDGLRAVHEVARRLELFKVRVIRRLVGGHVNVGEVIAGDGSAVQCGQGDVILLIVVRHTMHVLGIDETAADALLHIDQVELNDARDESPVLFVEAIAFTLLGGQL